MESSACLERGLHVCREMLQRIETYMKTDFNSFKEAFQTDEKALVRNGQVKTMIEPSSAHISSKSFMGLLSSFPQKVYGCIHRQKSTSSSHATHRSQAETEYLDAYQNNNHATGATNRTRQDES